MTDLQMTEKPTSETSSYTSSDLEDIIKASHSNPYTKISQNDCPSKQTKSPTTKEKSDPAPHSKPIEPNENTKLILQKPDNTITLLQLGNCIRFKINKDREWFGTLGTLVFLIIMIQSLHITSYCHNHITSMHTVSMCFSGMLLFFFIWTAFLDPGYRSKAIYESEITIGRTLICDHCNSWRDERFVHCYLCKRCVKGFDHHCNVIGNCIGRNNLWGFRLWVTSVFVGFGILIINFLLTICICYIEEGN